MNIRCFFLVLFFILFGKTFAQVKLLNTTLIYPDSAVVYIGIDNRFKVEGLDSSKVYSVKVSTGTISQNPYQRFDEYILRASVIHAVDTVSVWYKNKIIFSKVHRTDMIGIPVAILDNIPPGFIGKNQLANAKELKVCIPNCLVSNLLPMVGFQVHIVCKKCDDLPDIPVTGPYISNKLEKYIPYLSSGDKIFFEEIKVRACLNRKLTSISYTIK